MKKKMHVLGRFKGKKCEREMRVEKPNTGKGKNRIKIRKKKICHGEMRGEGYEVRKKK